MIRLVSLNIERSKHLDLVIPFLKAQDADVVCLQELMEYDVSVFEEICGPCFFTPMTRHPAEEKPAIIGTGIFTRSSVTEKGERYYLGGRDRIVDFDSSSAQRKHETESIAVAFLDIEKDGTVLRVATTHFTWTPDGNPDNLQRADMKNLLATLAPLSEFVLCGDFNAPRGGEIFSALAEKYKDNIPAHYTTSIDKDLHRAGDLQLMVDGLFSTPSYAVANVLLHSGVSDHMAITADVSKAESA